MKEMNIPEDKSFGRTMAFLLMAIATYIYFQLDKLVLPLFITSIILVIIAQLIPKILHPLNYLWTLFGFLMSKITNPIFLTIVYFMTITPMGILLRILNKDLLRLKFKAADESYWITKEESRTSKEAMKAQF